MSPKIIFLTYTYRLLENKLPYNGRNKQFTIFARYKVKKKNTNRDSTKKIPPFSTSVLHRCPRTDILDRPHFIVKQPH